MVSYECGNEFLASIKMWGMFWIAEHLRAFQEGLCCAELVSFVSVCNIMLKNTLNNRQDVFAGSLIEE